MRNLILKSATRQRQTRDEMKWNENENETKWDEMKWKWSEVKWHESWVMTWHDMHYIHTYKYALKTLSFKVRHAHRTMHNIDTCNIHIHMRTTSWDPYRVYIYVHALLFLLCLLHWPLINNTKEPPSLLWHSEGLREKTLVCRKYI